MDDKTLQSDIEIAEELDEQLQGQAASIEDIKGTMEAVTQAVDPLGVEPVELTQHQKDRVADFYSLSQDSKDPVIAVADKAALEGFMEVTSGIAKRAAIAFGRQVPDNFTTTAKGIYHYVGMADKLRARLLQLRTVLEKREYPFTDVFDYGAYSRFFQVNGKAINNFTAFDAAMQVQKDATEHTVMASYKYAVPTMQRLLESLQALQIEKGPDPESLVTLRDNVASYWDFTWKQAEITKEHGQTPQCAINAFPERRFTSIAPLLDNRYLVAHEPKNSGGQDPVRITNQIKHYGASMVFDKEAKIVPEDSMNIPNTDALLKLVIGTINGLYELKGLEDLAKQNEAFARDFKKATDILTKHVNDQDDPKFFGFIAEYFKLGTAVGQAIQQPYVHMAWMYVRCAMVVTSMAELAVLEEPHQRVVANRFASKQNKEFSNPALESFTATQGVLRAARRATSR